MKWDVSSGRRDLEVIEVRILPLGGAGKGKAGGFSSAFSEKKFQLQPFPKLRKISQAKHENATTHIKHTFRMGKRPGGEVEDGNQAYLKRQKISNPGKVTVPAEAIRSGRQLQQILAFDQDAGRSKHGDCPRSTPKRVLLISM